MQLFCEKVINKVTNNKNNKWIYICHIYPFTKIESESENVKSLGQIISPNYHSLCYLV